MKTLLRVGSMPIDYLVTHSGGFHADELLSTVILTRVFPAAIIQRSRDKAWVTPHPDRIIYDVGGAYDAQQQIFDHHQRNAPRRENGKPYSSFGLVWKHFGEIYLRSSGIAESDIANIHEAFDGSFVVPIDLADNGALEPPVTGPMASMTLPVLLEMLKPVFDDTSPDAEDRAFQSAFVIARSFLEAKVGQMAAKQRAKAVVQQAIAAAGDGHILELPAGMPFRSEVIAAGADHLLFVVNPRGKDWTLGGIRLHEDGLELRADLPEAWAGLTDAALEEACGVKGARFCHNARFIATADSREAMLAMAAIAVKEATCVKA